MLHDLLSPLLTSAMTYVITLLLGAIVVLLKKLVSDLTTIREITKSLSRSDLISRYQGCRDHGGWMSDERKREWFDDLALYEKLKGKNGYLENVEKEVIDMPTCESGDCGEDD